MPLKFYIGIWAHPVFKTLKLLVMTVICNSRFSNCSISNFHFPVHRQSSLSSYYTKIKKMSALSPNNSETFDAESVRDRSPHTNTNTLEEIKEKLRNKTYLSAANPNGKSACWKTFNLIYEAETNRKIGYVQCTTCLQIIKYDSKKTGASSLTRHATVTCKTYKKEQDIMIEEIPTNTKSSILNSAVKWCAEDMRAFQSVSGSGFINFAQDLIDVGAKIGRVNAEKLLPHSTTVSRHCIQQAEDARRKFIPEVLDAIRKGECSFTTDLWTDNYKRNSYITVNAHYVQDSKIIVRTLFTGLFEQASKTAENIRSEIRRRLTKIGISPLECGDVVFVTDQGSNIVKACRLEGWSRHDCQAHLLNTILRNTFEEKYISVNLPEVDHLLKNAKSLVAYMKRSGATNDLRTTLKQEVETRWNSKYNMLVSIYDQWDVIEQSLEKVHEENRLNVLDRHLMAALIKFLRPFEDATLELQVDNTPTIHRILLWHRTLQQLYSHAPNETDLFFLDQDVEMTEDDSQRLQRYKKIMDLLRTRATTFITSKFEDRIDYKVATMFSPQFKNLKMLSVYEVSLVHNRVKELIRLHANANSTGNDISGESSITENEEAIDQQKCDRFSIWMDIPQSRSNRSTEDELKKYINLPPTTVPDTELLSWWRNKEEELPVLSSIAKKILSVPATSASSERAFSAAGYILNARRSRLKPEIVDAILVLHDAKKN